MKPILVACLLVILVPLPAAAADDAGAMLDKAVAELVKLGYLGDTSSAERYLAAVLAEQPENLEARWQRLFIPITSLRNVPLTERAPLLAALSPEFGRLAKTAETSKQTAFLHYIKAFHAWAYMDYERALGEIDRALAVEPKSVRFLAAKGRFQIDHANWICEDREVEAGVKTLAEARALLHEAPSPFLHDEDFEFYLAVGKGGMCSPPWAEVIDHYKRFIAASQPSLRQAFAWNNVSVAYQKLGACAEAKEAAGKSIAISEFNAALENEQRSEFCLQMQNLGVVATPTSSPG